MVQGGKGGGGGAQMVIWNAFSNNTALLSAESDECTYSSSDATNYKLILPEINLQRKPNAKRGAKPAKNSGRSGGGGLRFNLCRLKRG